MKSYRIILLFLVSLFVFSCSDNLTDLGTGIQPISDQISIKTDTFHLFTETDSVRFIYSKPDSFLLGTYYDTKFGSTKGEILAQVNCPVGFKFLPFFIPDSASIVLLYKTWFGPHKPPYDPLDVNIYEMNISTFNYPKLYQTNINPSDYTDQSLRLSEGIFSAKDPVKLRADSTAIRFKLNSDFVQRFFKTDFSSTDNFLTKFKGIYITANYGSSTLLNISKVFINYYYHYIYITKNIHGGDSTVTVNNILHFPANSEVRQVNRFLHPNRNTLVPPADNVNYVASPANWDTRVIIPLDRIKQKMDAGIANKKPTINSAIIKVEATNIDVDTVSAPTVRYMLLIKESAVDRFFKNKELPSDTCAVLAGHSVSLIVNTTNQYEDYYSFSVAKLIANELKIATIANQNPIPVPMRLIAVQVTLNSKGSVTSVKQSNLLSAVTIRSGKNVDSPMRLNIVYSGF